jgi:predicted secreted protein
MRAFALAAAVLAAFVLAGPAASATVTIGSGYDGKTARLHIGDVLRLRLDGNDSTPFRWVVAGVDRKVLAPHGSTYESDPAPKGYTGVPGVYTFRFEALATGATTLKLSVKELGGTRVVQRFSVKVVVSR